MFLICSNTGRKSGVRHGSSRVGETTRCTLRMSDSRTSCAGAILEATTTAGGHDWQSWNAAMADLFRSAGKTLRQPERSIR